METAIKTSGMLRRELEEFEDDVTQAYAALKVARRAVEIAEARRRGTQQALVGALQRELAVAKKNARHE